MATILKQYLLILMLLSPGVDFVYVDLATLLMAHMPQTQTKQALLCTAKKKNKIINWGSNGVSYKPF